MQQRFSAQEQQQLGLTPFSATELQSHVWIAKTKEGLSAEVSLNLRELLQISNDNGVVNNIRGSSQENENLSEDF
jgi:hypothetical protein